MVALCGVGQTVSVKMWHMAHVTRCHELKMVNPARLAHCGFAHVDGERIPVTCVTQVTYTASGIAKSVSGDPS